MMVPKVDGSKSVIARKTQFWHSWLSAHGIIFPRAPYIKICLVLFVNSSKFSLTFPPLLNVQKHGLKVYMRDPHAFTPMLEEGIRGQPPRSLLLGSDLAKNQKEIGKFSEKDAKVCSKWLLRIYRACFSCALVF